VNTLSNSNGPFFPLLTFIDFDRFFEHHPAVREKLKRIAGEDFNRFTGVLTSPLDDVVNEGVYLKLLRDFLSYWVIN
jgi:hypothetical protein